MALWAEGRDKDQPESIRSVWPLWGRPHILSLDESGRPVCWCGPTIEILVGWDEWEVSSVVAPDDCAVITHKLAADEQ